MAVDNTQLNTGTGGDLISSDAITTLNGGAIVTGEKAQRVKIGFGSDSFFRDVDATYGLPISGAIPLNVNVSGTLSASDAVVAAPIGDGTLISGTSTTGSVVAAVVPDGMVAWTLLIKGYVSGTIYTEASTNSTNGTDGDWVEVKGRRTGTAVGIESIQYAMISNGYYRGNTAGFKYIRARLIGGISPTIQWMISNGQGATFLNSGIPAGTSVIGRVGIDQTTPGTTNNITLSSGTVAIGARSDGFINIHQDPTTLLFDTFESLDTTNTWTVGGTVSPTAASGVLTFGANATASATSYATSKPSFIPGSSAYLQYAALVTIDGAASTGTNRFWGLGVYTTPTTALPITNGSIFEVDTTGVLFASAYSGGARTQQVALTKPTDGLVHRYAIYHKASKVTFEIDNITVASISFPNPNVAALMTVIGQANSAAVTGTNTLSATLVGVGDTGRNASKIADGLYPWRTATIKPASTVAVSTDTALVVTQHPSSPTPPGTNVIGKVGIDQTTPGTTNNVTLSTLTAAIGARADGFLRAQIDPTTLLFDTFETLDTTNTWTTGGTAPPTGSSGNLVINAGATVSASSYATSKPTFISGSNAYLQYAALITIDGTASTGTNRFWGIGVYSAPTVTVPITNGSIFEVDTTGVLFASVYSNGARTLQVALAKPTDGTVHRYSIYYKASKVYYELDNVIVATISFPNPAVAALSTVIGQVNSGTVTGTNTLTATLIGLADTGRNALKIADGTYPWRKASIGVNGGVSIKGAPVLGVSVSIAAAATGTVGPLDVSEAGNVTYTVKNTIAANAYAGAPVLVFEQSDDNVSWGPMNVSRVDTGAQGTTFTLGPNTASTSLMFNAPLQGGNWARVRVTTGPTTNAMTIVMSPGGLPFVPNVGTLDRKDVGRNQTNYFMTIPILTTATDTLMSLTGFKGSAAVAATTTPAVVTAGKTFRLVSATITYVATATAGTAKFTIRAQAGGVVTLASPAVQVWNVGGPAVVAGVSQTVAIAVPDGFEFAAGTGIGVSMVGLGATQLAAIVGYGQLSLHGFEY